MKQVSIITTKMRIEFKDGDFTEWDKEAKNFYGFETYEKCYEEIQNLRRKESIRYKQWLKEKVGVFIHHEWFIDNILILE